jgi:hypothetical protein
VNLSPDVILDQIYKSFNLTVHNHDVVEGSNGMFHVRLKMDMPCVGGSAVTERVKLVGDPAAVGFFPSRSPPGGYSTRVKSRSMI